MATTQNKKQVFVSQEKLVTYKERSVLFGLIKWREVTRTDVMSNDLEVLTAGTDIHKLFIDGIEIDISNWKLSDWKTGSTHNLNK